MKQSTDIQESRNTLENNDINSKKVTTKSKSSKSSSEEFGDKTSFKNKIKLNSINENNENNKNISDFRKITRKQKLELCDHSILVSKDNLLEKSKASSKNTKKPITDEISKLQNSNNLNICAQKNSNFITNNENINRSPVIYNRRKKFKFNSSKPYAIKDNIITLKINNIDKGNKAIMMLKHKNSKGDEGFNESEEKKNNYLKKKSIKNLNNSENNSSSSSFNFDINKIGINNKKRNHYKLYIENLIVSSPFLLFIFLTSLFSLFSNDIKFIFLSKKVDIYFDIINIIIFVIYIFQIVITCIYENYYFNSIFFWIDIIGIFGILFEIQLINFPLIGYDENFQKNKNIFFGEKFNEIFLFITRIARTTKLLDRIKILKKIHLRKTYEKFFNEKQKKEEEQNKKLHEKMQSLGEDDINESDISNVSMSKQTYYNSKNNKMLPRKKSSKNFKRFISTLAKSSQGSPIKNGINKKRDSFSSKNLDINQMKKNENHQNSDSEEKNNEQKKIKEEENKKKKEEVLEKIDDQQAKLSTKVSNSINGKIILVTSILLLIITIIYEEFNYRGKNNFSNYYFIEKLLSNNSLITSDYIEEISIMFDDEYPIINIAKNNSIIYSNSKYQISNFRLNELKQIENFSENNNQLINIIYSEKKNFTTLHIIYLIETFLIYIIILLSSIYFENQICGIFLDKIEVMIEIADKVAKDPMNAKNIDELKGDMYLNLNNENENKISLQDDRLIKEKDINKKYEKYNNSYEVQIIMTALIKISALLAMSLGEAGVDIIKKNLSSQQEIHLHLKGKKKSAIFGFCNIRNFDKLNIALEEETILLVNEVAEIIHSSVDRYRGDTNKNMGDSFFNVWKFINKINIKNKNPSKYITKDNLLDIDPSNPQISITADCAILAYLRCLLKINKNLNILAYRHKNKIENILPNFKLSMGFGLHLGYGIEGPVGSLFKLEASYLGPDVNIAARLETATQQFGVGILISGSLYKILTDDMKSILRYVDCVIVKGSTEPIDLYTVDLNYDVSPQNVEKFLSNDEKLEKYKEKKNMIEYLIKEYGSITPMIIDKESYYEFLMEKSDQFYYSWDNGINNYKNGDWKSAKNCFEVCLEEDPEDGPTNTLYNFIKDNNFESPKDWKGYRELTCK